MPELGSKLAAVAIGRNEGARLRRCLQSLLAEGLCIMYVDSASTDGSIEMAKGLGANIHMLGMDRPFTAARARSEGLGALEQLGMAPEFIFFIDGDCEVEAGWSARAVAFLDGNPAFAAVCGRRRERAPNATPYNSIMDREWDTPAGECGACGGDAIYRRVMYHEVGGFDPKILAGEEPEFCARLLAAGFKIMRLDIPMTIHDAAMTSFSQWWQRAIRSGFGYAQVYKHSGLYRWQIYRALAWALLLPLISIFLAVSIDHVLILTWPAMVFAQFLRVLLRDGIFVAWLAVVGKYAELIGISRFLLGSITSASYR